MSSLKCPSIRRARAVWLVNLFLPLRLGVISSIGRESGGILSLQRPSLEEVR